ncbi:Small secreted domain [Actinacidiphila alni]|uniref:Small secreted domain n=1 Tax=Actinacidiphila alni TaxID=380248 RepID=A0A1I1ZIB6_9ACTN|nr:chaplin [Actinacidiphila alni]SFE31352.1 Small secreted domain [Actinacidiphila alni]
MRHILSRSLLTVAAASSILAATGGIASADSDAQGGASGSPGLLSGNSVEAPIDVPVNACGNSVNVVGADNAALGNKCTNASHSHAAPHTGSGAQSGTQSGTESGTGGSPGVASGNSVKIPVDVPLDLCGNTVDVVGLLNAVTGNSCANDGTGAHAGTGTGTDTHSVHTDPPTQVRDLPPAPGKSTRAVPAVDQESLAETGTSGGGLGTAGAASAALLLGGAMLYRRGRGGPRPAHAAVARSAAHDRIRRTYSAPAS